MNKFRIIALLFLIFIKTVSAQITDTASVIGVISSDFNAGISDAGHFITLPFNSTGEEWMKAAAAAGITAALFLADNPVRDLAEKNHTAFMDELTKAGSFYGNGVVPLVLSAGLYTSGLIADNSELRSTGRVLFESLAAAGIAVSVLKVVIGRSRPYMDNGNTFFKPFNFKNDFNSLPSGHTIVAFTTSTVLAGKLKNIYASIGLYGLATLTVYQRIYSDNHWISDTFLGAALGYGIGRFFLSLNENADTDKKFNLSILPSVMNNGTAVNVVVRF